MSWTLDIEFGGLCLFVRRENPVAPGFQVLLPRFKEPNMEHVAVLEYPLHGVPKLRVSIEETFIDLTPYAEVGNTTQLPPGLLPVSRVAGRAVEERWLSGAIDGAIIARIRLPLTARLRGVGDPARMRPSTGTIPAGDYYGRVNASIEIRDDVTEIPLGSARIFRPHNHAGTQIRIVHAMRGDIDCPKRRRHNVGDRSPHFPAYYQMLFPDGTVPAGLPDMISDEDKAEEASCRYNLLLEAMDDTVRRRALEAAMFIEPFFCTVGFGCPPEEPNC